MMVSRVNTCSVGDGVHLFLGVFVVCMLQFLSHTAVSSYIIVTVDYIRKEQPPSGGITAKRAPAGEATA